MRHEKEVCSVKINDVVQIMMYANVSKRKMQKWRWEGGDAVTKIATLQKLSVELMKIVCELSG
jgi:hypothetical protein